MNTWHSTSNITDQQAEKLAFEHVEAVEAVKGELIISRTQGHGSAIVVLRLPDGVRPEQCFGSLPFEEVHHAE